MKTIPKAKADLFRVLWLLREMARLEASLVSNYQERRIWNEVHAWAEGTAREHGLDLDTISTGGTAAPETANVRFADGATRKGARRGGTGPRSPN